MEKIVFVKAKKQSRPVKIALAGGTGSGKTKSMLRLARGLAGDDGVVFGIDTENGRMSEYALEHDFMYYSLRPPFSPKHCLEAIKAAEAAGAAVIMFDSITHEWNGIGGCQDMQEATLDRMTRSCKTEDEKFEKAEKVSALAWKDAKGDHRDLMTHIDQSQCHFVFGLRAEHKMRVAKEKNPGDKKERTVFHDAAWTPLTEKHFMFEMTSSFMLYATAPGVPEPIKLNGQHKLAFPAGEVISEECGKRMLQWSQIGAGTGRAASKLVLRDGMGGEVKQYERGGDFLNGLETALNELGEGDGAGALWDKNSDTFYAVLEQAQAKGNKDALNRCTQINTLVGKLVRPDADQELQQ